MRVAIDGLLLSGFTSGVERAIVRLAMALPRVAPGADYRLYCPADTNTHRLAEAGLHIRRAPFSGRQRLVRILWQQAFLPRVLRQEGADVLLAAGYVLPLKWQGPSVLVVYDVIALEHPKLARRSNVWHYRLVLPPSARRATRIVVPSAHVRAGLAARCGVPLEKISVVPLGVDPIFRRVQDARILAAVRERYHLPERFLLFVGRLEPKKNLERLLEAFRQLRTEGLPHCLVLSGDSSRCPASLRRDLERAAAAGDVVLTGFVCDEDLPALYSLADLFVFPSLTEGFGLPPLEAMACGTPVLVADVPPFTETVADVAIRVDPRDPNALAEGIRRGLAEEGLRKRLAQAGPARAACFTWEQTAIQVALCIQAAAGRKGTESGSEAFLEV